MRQRRRRSQPRCGSPTTSSPTSTRLALVSQTVEVVGDEAPLTDSATRAGPGSTSSARQKERIAIEPEKSYRRSRVMSAAIRRRGAARLGRADAIGQAKTIEALYQAADGPDGESCS
jgi:hypothetical protein